MRIVAGAWRGRAIRTPEGPATRPTSDRARQAVFNILEHAPWSPGVDGQRVIDLFAGSGALGLEALSRGADVCLFVERAEPALAAIRANAQAFGAGASAKLLRQDATRLGARPPDEGPFDLAFLDPPYGKGLGEEALQALKPGATAVLERGADEESAIPDGYELLDERRYGAAKVAFLRRVTD